MCYGERGESPHCNGSSPSLRQRRERARLLLVGEQPGRAHLKGKVLKTERKCRWVQGTVSGMEQRSRVQEEKSGRRQCQGTEVRGAGMEKAGDQYTLYKFSCYSTRKPPRGSQQSRNKAAFRLNRLTKCSGKT